MKGFLFLTLESWSSIHAVSKLTDSRKEKEARMNIRINYIFWKQGPLLPRLLAGK